MHPPRVEFAHPAETGVKPFHQLELSIGKRPRRLEHLGKLGLEARVLHQHQQLLDQIGIREAFQQFEPFAAARQIVHQQISQLLGIDLLDHIPLQERRQRRMGQHLGAQLGIANHALKLLHKIAPAHVQQILDDVVDL